jgi:hypothetical protein
MCRIDAVAGAALLAAALAASSGLVVSRADQAAQDRVRDRRIDRRALVTRHNPTLRRADPLSPLSLGNGEFAFTADVTGLQTFPRFYARDEPPRSGRSERGSTPLVTQSQWGWHSFANPRGFKPEDAYERYDAHGRSVEYASAQTSAAGAWLRENPHRLNLARIGFVLRKGDGAEATLDDLQQTEQTLDLWTGTLSSRFTLEGAQLRVESWVHPQRDLLAVRVSPGELTMNRLAVRIAFPYVRAVHSGDPSDWSHPAGSRTSVAMPRPGAIEWLRTLDTTQYSVSLGWAGSARIDRGGPHEWLLSFERADRPLEFVISFSEQPGPQPATVDETRSASAGHWQGFWERGGALDLSGSADPRASELERRVVLSQYLTAIQGSGSRPPQETGLTYNSWFGKFHLEMHWWHAAHFALWNRVELLERSLPWYTRILDSARDKARRQGYKGARWPKMTAPDGRDSPSGVGVFLIWQQPHPIHLAELVYRQRPDRRTLERYRELVFESATFMASYATWREHERRYVLGPPLIPAQEIHPAPTTVNPGFELAYWRFGLETAQRWRERLGLPRDAEWDRVLAHLSPLPARGGLYVNAESAPETFTRAPERRDHPTLLAPCGILPCADVDREMMRRTLAAVMRSWNFGETWGWDYPLIAMTAARVGEPALAIDALLMDTQKNTYLANGHNYQDARLTVYLPGNGGLLTAVAMMAAGWDGAPDVPAPGFPKDGRWHVRWEGLRPLP